MILELCSFTRHRAIHEAWCPALDLILSSIYTIPNPDSLITSGLAHSAIMIADYSNHATTNYCLEQSYATILSATIMTNILSAVRNCVDKLQPGTAII